MIDAPLFSAGALHLLDRQSFDPAAKPSYDVLSDGLIWADEFPKRHWTWRALNRGGLNRFLIAYRAQHTRGEIEGVITLGENRINLRPIWEQVLLYAPSWPGLRSERCDNRARRRLTVLRKQASRCLREIEREMDADT